MLILDAKRSLKAHMLCRRESRSGAGESSSRSQDATRSALEQALSGMPTSDGSFDEVDSQVRDASPVSQEARNSSLPILPLLADRRITLLGFTATSFKQYGRQVVSGNRWSWIPASEWHSVFCRKPLTWTRSGAREKPLLGHRACRALAAANSPPSFRSRSSVIARPSLTLQSRHSRPLTSSPRSVTKHKRSLCLQQLTCLTR